MLYIKNASDVLNYLEQDLNIEQDTVLFTLLESEIKNLMDGTVELTIADPDNKIFVVSGLSYDSDTENPLESDEGAGELIKFKSYEQKDEVLKKLAKSKKLFYFVEKYEHGNVHYSIVGTRNYPDRQWDVSSPCGVFVPCDDVQKIYKKAIKTQTPDEAANQFIQESNNLLDTYSSWCNGENYVTQTSVVSLKSHTVDTNTCGGYIGYDFAKKCLTEEVNSLVISTLVNKEKVNNVIKSDLTDKTKLPFRISKKGLIGGTVNIYKEHFIVSAKYSDGNDETGKVYEWKEGDSAPTKSVYGELQKSYNVSVNDFLKINAESRLNSIIKSEMTTKRLDATTKEQKGIEKSKNKM